MRDKNKHLLNRKRHCQNRNELSAVVAHNGELPVLFRKRFRTLDIASRLPLLLLKFVYVFARFRVSTAYFFSITVRITTVPFTPGLWYSNRELSYLCRHVVLRTTLYSK